MGIHDKMIQDQIWVRPHVASDANVEGRTHGQHYLYLASPNSKERIEMAYRSLGRQFDWDMEKFRNSPKPSDKGNKRRFFKNVARFIKNPLGYSYWKSYRVLQRAPFVLTFLILSFVADFFKQRNITNSQKAVENYLYYQGSESFPKDFVDTLAQPARLGIPNTVIWRSIYSYPRAYEFVINPVYEQNYRKYFDTFAYNPAQVRRV